MTDCFCGCGRDIKGLRLNASNKIAAQMVKDLALFRGGIADRLVEPQDVAELERLIAEGERHREFLQTYLHGQAQRADMDREGVKEWLSRASGPRSDISVATTGLGFHGGGLGLPGLLYGGRRSPGVITQLRDTGTTINEQPRVRVTIEVHPSDAAAFSTTTKMLVSRVDPPRVGDKVEIAYDPDEPETFAFRRTPEG